MSRRIYLTLITLYSKLAVRQSLKILTFGKHSLYGDTLSRPSTNGNIV